ncbi:MAG: hypothetical protein RIQ37_450 [Actinomycetota bacterium]|jgi:fructuronate reductase
MTERIVHIGLGAFFRAHQAWYTQHSSEPNEWQIVAYTGRSPQAADELNAQGCDYTLIERGVDGDRLEKITVISRAVPGSDIEDFLATMAKPEIAIVTLTITEAAYLTNESDLEASALGRLALGLEARRLAGGFPIAVVPCDNMPDNAEVIHRALSKLGASLGKEFIDYLDSKVSFVSTSIDRITPKTTKSDIESLKLSGIEDNSPVVTESFSDWILSGEFPAGRPDWEKAGAKFVSNITAFENRKLWLLNGSHTLLASLGQLRGHETVAQAISDPVCRNAVEELWDSAENNLTEPGLDISAYRAALIARFENPRIEHRLAQIVQDSSIKLSVRIAPVANSELSHGRVPAAAATAFAAWILLAMKGPVTDQKASLISQALSGADPVRSMIEVVSEELASEADFVEAVREEVKELQTMLDSNRVVEPAVMNN